MDRLFHSAQKGDVEELQKLLKEQPLILHHMPFTCTENPLHYSCAAGHLDFTKAILELKPDLAGDLNAHGYSPLHLASANGHIAIVKEIVRVDPSICHLPGREGNTPLHAAVLRGKVDVIYEMIEKCEGCLEDVTFQKETALHLAIKNIQFGSFKIMLDWIRRKNLGEILNMKDEHGNMILHLAVWKKQRQVLDLLVENVPGLLEVNAINNSGLTALDLLLIFPSEAGDRELQEVLQRAGALKAQDLALHITTHSCSTRNTPANSTTSTSRSNLIQFFKFHAGRDSPSDVRSTLLVIAILVATATYQVGISPPGGTWQDDDRGHVAGTSIMGSHDLGSYVLLVGFNSLGFNVSLYMIAILTSKFPLTIDLQVLLFSLYFTFNLTTIATSPGRSKVFAIVITSVLPTVVPLTGNLLRKYEVLKCLLRMFRRGR
ncbi:hypothetical protein RND81_13G184800 [Saponaria officinalis]|uniref:PGG domain-containing protein n=1 Tax=Saponaria officinalis TaxID=3572 RepID=A0AAW1H4K4_SAPOF